MGKCYSSCFATKDDNIELDEKTPSEKNGEITEKIEVPDKEKWRTDIKSIWGRTYDQLPVHSDLPRLGRKIRLLDKDDNVILGNEHYQDLTPQKINQLLIKKLAEYYYPEIVEGDFLLFILTSNFKKKKYNFFIL